MTAASSKLAILQPKGFPQGTPEFEQRRGAILEAFAKKVPPELRLPVDLIASPPLDVSNIPSTCGILTPREVDITENYDASGLAEAVAGRQLTATEVAISFSKRSIIAHQLTCCLTQWFMDDAIEQAKELDDYLEKNGTTVGPLHGVPISIKEHIPLAGTYSSQGSFASIVLNEKDCYMVSILRSMGAVFYCKTNQPQTIMHLESTSHYGRTLNPFNIHLSAGGSSGGEGALVAMKGSVLGIGTDIGGSIRCPSAFCGIYGFKPTSYVLPMKDYLAHSFSAELNVLCSTGPMCRSLRDMDLLMRSVLAVKPHLLDQKLIPIPWTGLKTSNTKPLKIGIIENDGFIDPQPPVKRAIAWARERLSDPKYSDTFQVKTFKPYNAEEAWSMICRMYWLDGGQLAKDDIVSTGEPILSLSDWIWKEAKPHGMLNAEDVNQLRATRDEFRYKFVDSWNEQDVDIVIGPAFVGPACAHDTALYWTYTSLYNLVDYPGVVAPTPIRTEAKEQYATDYRPLSEACKHVKELWEASNFEGAPIDLQINARKYHDNELFGALAVLKDVLELP
ncbi:general amidase-like protein GmdB [Cucurbitaria berberidis CBS 394.84]|uniref:amidase n=1 Tax=Cucurbitaria berberidis CBS 394.84 TaxID=1168544 RepID=A0A9P4GLX6_9PLEO|nr:general amidase-like protein GmdB [Cucurbitaria berberidis CBS 394.84]KAF1847995.1 general amidase-like protein GmdB [Cucurbitaria berberidis CBS 394.84]